MSCFFPISLPYCFWYAPLFNLNTLALIKCTINPLIPWNWICARVIFYFHYFYYMSNWVFGTDSQWFLIEHVWFYSSASTEGYQRTIDMKDIFCIYCIHVSKNIFHCIIPYPLYVNPQGKKKCFTGINFSDKSGN